MMIENFASLPHTKTMLFSQAEQARECRMQPTRSEESQIGAGQQLVQQVPAMPCKKLMKPVSGASPRPIPFSLTIMEQGRSTPKFRLLNCSPSPKYWVVSALKNLTYTRLQALAGFYTFITNYCFSLTCRFMTYWLEGQSQNYPTISISPAPTPRIPWTDWLEHIVSGLSDTWQKESPCPSTLPEDCIIKINDWLVLLTICLPLNIIDNDEPSPVTFNPCWVIICAWLSSESVPAGR